MSYAAWKEPNPDRPWIASFRRALRWMTFGDWVVCAILVGYNVLISASSKADGGLFTGDLPRWTSKLVLGLFWAVGYVWFRQMHRRHRNTFPILQPTLPDSWVPVTFTIRHALISDKMDFGGATVEDGQLKFSGQYTAFQISVNDAEVRHIDKYGHAAKLRIPSTRQRFSITLNRDGGEREWQAFLAKLVAEGMPETRPSIFPPKPRIQLRSILWWWAPMFIVADLLSLAGWRAVKALGLPTTVIFPILNLSLMALAFWALFRIDLLLWRRRRGY